MTRALPVSGILLSFALLGLNLLAVIPEYSVTDGAVQLQGVGPDNPILYPVS